MLRWVGWLALVTAFVVAAGCGGGDSGGDTPRTTTTPTSAVTSTTTSGGTGTAATTTTQAATTTTSGAAPSSPYEQFITDPEAFLETYADLVEPAQSLLGESPDYATADTFRAEATDLGLDLTGVEVWVWPVPATDDVFLVFDFDTAATSFEDSDVGEALGQAMATSPTLNAADITQLVITWQGDDAGEPFYLTFSAPYDEVRTAVLEDTDLDPDVVFFHLDREQ